MEPVPVNPNNEPTPVSNDPLSQLAGQTQAPPPAGVTHNVYQSPPPALPGNLPLGLVGASIGAVIVA